LSKYGFLKNYFLFLYWNQKKFLSGKYLKLSHFIGNDEKCEIFKNLLKGVLK